MSDERRDDEILGRALSRAIETIDVNQTPFERSRIATVPARRSIFGLWQVATAAAAIVLALAIGSWLTRPLEAGPVAASPTAPIPTPTPAATVTPAPTPPPTIVDRGEIYLARPSLPPVGVPGLQFGTTSATPELRIASRVTALRAYRQSAAPAGLTNYLWNNSFQGGVQVRIAGDLATVDLQLRQPFGVKDHAEAFAIVQQLVYTATEEPGIRRVLITINNGQPLTIGDIRFNKALAREDVFGYSSTGPLGVANGISFGGEDSLPHVGGQLGSVTVDGSTARITIVGRSTDTGATAGLPSFTVHLEQSDDSTATGAKYGIYVQLQWNGGGRSGGAAGLTVYDSTPLRSVSTDGSSVFRIELDDARPWRAYMPDKTQLVVEIGGDPTATSDRIAVTAPKPGDRMSGSVYVTGAARVFEANVAWRLKDASGNVIENGHVLASLGSSSLWGTFDRSLASHPPDNLHGNLTLELFEVSPKDGSDQGTVSIPITIP